MQTFFPSRQDVEDDDAIDYVILGELFMHLVYTRMYTGWAKNKPPFHNVIISPGKKTLLSEGDHVSRDAVICNN